MKKKFVIELNIQLKVGLSKIFWFRVYQFTVKAESCRRFATCGKLFGNLFFMV